MEAERGASLWFHEAKQIIPGLVTEDGRESVQIWNVGQEVGNVLDGSEITSKSLGRRSESRMANDPQGIGPRQTWNGSSRRYKD